MKSLKSLVPVLAVMLLASSMFASDAFGARQKKMTFRQALIAAAEDARDEGKLKTGELLRLRIATLNPKVLAKMQDAAVEQAVIANKMPLSAVDNLEAFDFTALLEFLKEFMPMLMELLKMFGLFSYDMPAVDYMLCAYEVPIDVTFSDTLAYDDTLDMLACGGLFRGGLIRGVLQVRPLRALRFMRPRYWPGIRRLPAFRGTLDYVPANNALCEGGICPA